MLGNLHLKITVELLLIVFIEYLICSLPSPKKKKKRAKQFWLKDGDQNTRYFLLYLVV